MANSAFKSSTPPLKTTRFRRSLLSKVNHVREHESVFQSIAQPVKPGGILFRLFTAILGVQYIKAKLSKHRRGLGRILQES